MMVTPTIQAKPWYRARRFWLGALHVVAGLAAIPALGAMIPGLAIASGVAQILVGAVTNGPMTATAAGAAEINQQIPAHLQP